MFGVCVAGVSCLYLLPGAGRAPHQVGGSRPQNQSPMSPSAAPATATASATRSRPASATPAPAPTSTASQPRVEDTAERQPAASRSPSRGGAPFDPARSDDAVAPARVADVTSAAVTPDALTLRWPAASDNVGVVSYRVLLNGYEVATTPTTHATIRWFNDDARDQVVQVRALDAAGNQSPASASLVVERPTPSPTPTGTPTPSTRPEPTARPTPQPTPTPSATEPSRDASPGGPVERGEERPVIPSPSSRPTGAR